MKALFIIFNKIETVKKMEIQMIQKIRVLIQFIIIMFIANIAKECLPHVKFIINFYKNKVTAERHIPKCKNIFNRPKPP